ncbi:MAG: esterase-like activity of phytase family protein [Pseudomonadota bacterium]
MQLKTAIRCWLGPRFGLKRALVAGGVALGAAAGIAIADPKPDTSRLATQTITVSARQIASFERVGGSRTRYGKLEWLGGLELQSNAASFGGWSGLAMSANGTSLLAVSDAGTWMTADLGYDGRRPEVLKSVRTGPLKALAARSLTRGRDRDAEAVVLLEGDLDRGKVLIAFEQNHRIGTFDIGPGGLSPPRGYLALPTPAKRMSSLKGFEAIAMLRGGPRKGALVALAEHHLDRNGNHQGWVQVRGAWEGFAMKNIGGYDPTDAAALPDGSLLILERRFRWLEGVKMRLRYVKAQDIRPGALIEGEPLLEADMSQEIDNMEALAVHTSARGETIVTLMSDDNFNHFLQRTVLLQFAIPPDALASLTR